MTDARRRGSNGSCSSPRRGEPRHWRRDRQRQCNLTSSRTGGRVVGPPNPWEGTATRPYKFIVASLRYRSISAGSRQPGPSRTIDTCGRRAEDWAVHADFNAPLPRLLTNQNAMTSRSIVRGLLVAAIGLPVLQGLMSWVAGLLLAMGDQAAARILYVCGTVAGVLWLIAMAALLIALGIRSLERDQIS